jgi:hypothetical protein
MSAKGTVPMFEAAMALVQAFVDSITGGMPV